MKCLGHGTINLVCDKCPVDGVACLVSNEWLKEGETTLKSCSGRKSSAKGQKGVM